MTNFDLSHTNHILERIVSLLESIHHKEHKKHSFDDRVYVWESDTNHQHLRPVLMESVLSLEDLLGVDEQKHTLYENTKQFSLGYPANNALLWGVRGTGKSSLVKSVVHALQRAEDHDDLILIEMHREDLRTLSRLLEILRSQTEKKFLIFCDDLSFDGNDEDYKSLKSVLEGGVESRPSHVLFYATSNRRHLLPRDMMENEAHDLIHGGESMEEKISLSDRFGLWLGFHAMNQATYLAIVEGYLERMGVKPLENLQEEAKRWSRQRGQMSGRVAYQFACDVAGKYALTR